MCIRDRVYRGNARLLYNQEVYYENYYHRRFLNNYPILKQLVKYSIPTRNPPVMPQDIEWRLLNHPVYYVPHRNNREQRYRIPRYVRWDGTMNMPLMPFANDVGTGVATGQFAINFNNDPRYK